MRVRYKNHKGQWVEGQSSEFNPLSLSEVIVWFDDGSADSMPISNLEVMLSSGHVSMLEAIRGNYLEFNNENGFWEKEDSNAGST